MAKKKKKKKKNKSTMAGSADRHALYQESVQTPEADVDFFTQVYKEHRDKTPLVLREDFCGTAYIAATWAKSKKKRRAIGIDLDEPTLDWGRQHNLKRLKNKTADRVELYCANVLDGVGDKADVTCALNFSYQVFHTRRDLVNYFEVVHERLNDDGIFVTELYGGFEAVVELEEKRDCDDFTYIWEQKTFNPIDHRTLCHIHFKFEDGSRIDEAFTYDWRLWTLPEMRECLLEAGFKKAIVYWEEVEDEPDEDGECEGTGEFHPTEEEENQASWLAYLVAVK